MADRYKFKTKLRSKARDLRSHGRTLEAKKEHKRDIQRAGGSIYATERWKQLAKRYKKQHPRCVECGATNKERQLYVDHIVEIQDLPQRENDPLVWDESNLQTLCARCHGKKTHTKREERSHSQLLKDLNWLDE